MATSRRSKNPKKQGLSLTAVALQDHIARNAGLVKTTNHISPHRPVAIVRQHQQTRSSEVERVLDADHPPLTLAQRLGLVAKPAPLLTESQWNSIKIASHERGDSSQPCPICQDDFKLKAQVLLSCSHTFHKSCLLAFERFSGKKHCPVCRHPLYQTRVINAASKIYRERAATRIQAAWRGYCVRKWYETYCETHPPLHPALKKKYYEKKLTSLTNKFVEDCNDTSDTLDSFFASIDDNVRQSRRTMSMLDSKKEAVPWENIKEKAKLFLASSCAVCLTELSTVAVVDCRPLSVLSCSHLFHNSCISSLELYSQSTQPYLCPICRNPYVRSNF